ncbi:MAG: type IV pilus assembly protein PilM [Planctomycetaceae bacterium]|nr:type IV pilus assembly protein PilM [Planctomycetaceae bacterium]
MAKKQTVWGIDVGNTSLKAVRCALADESGKIEALACDFIEHSKVLSQPGTDVAEVLAETFQTFLSRNSTKGDRIAISVSGQNTISRFLPLPPVDPKKIPDVIRYEAKQWLPFDINDVVFDFQPLASPERNPEDGGFADATVGMFAIKRDMAAKTLSPYLSRGVDVDSIQSSPIALYNFVAFDQLAPADAESYDKNNPRESVVTLCIGTDATDVVITNGEKIWIRNIPLGGNSFTKALTRELQLTYSKAEYLKRNIAISKNVEEQKRVITAMRPVFYDMVNEVNRSLEYYQTLNRKARFQKIIVLGNASKLPGLRQFIAQNLGYEVVKIDQFANLVGTDVTGAQLFKDNLNSFAVAYGLAVQQLGVSSLKTNLIPRDVLYTRIIREKKPWMLAAAASLLLGLTIQFAGVSSAYNSVFTEGFVRAENKAKSVQTFASNLQTQTTQAVTDFNNVDEIGRSLTSNVEGRITWLELLAAINSALPQSQPDAYFPPFNQRLTSDEFAKMDRVFIESIEAISVDDLGTWFAPLMASNRYYPDDEELEVLLLAADSAPSTTSATSTSTATTTAATATAAATDDEDTDAELGYGVAVESIQQRVARLTEEERFALVTGPGGGGAAGGPSFGSPSSFSSPSSSSSISGGYSSGMGFSMGGPPAAKVVQLVGHHYHNPSDPNAFAEHGGEAYLRKTLLRNLKFGTVDLPPTLEEQQAGIVSATVTMEELGITFPVLLYVPRPVEYRIVNPDLEPLPLNITIDPQLQAELARGGQAGGMRGGGMSDGSGGLGSGMTGGGTGTGPRMLLSQLAMQRGVREPVITVRRFDFVIQFAWEETLPTQRKENANADEGDGAGVFSTELP